VLLYLAACKHGEGLKCMKSACGWRALLCLATFRAQSDVNIRVTSFVSCKIDKVTPVIVQLS
jgi:hypothetical protein